MKKGFTLIELLAVIVILAIIAVIAVPIVLNIIDETKDNANKRSIDMYAKAVENAIASYKLNGNSLSGSFTTTDGKTVVSKSDSNIKLNVEYDGSKVVCETFEINEEGSFYIENCTVNGDAVEYTYGEQSSNGTPATPAELTTLTPKTWNGLTGFYGKQIWTDGSNTYYSLNGNNYVLNGDTWEPKTWNGLTNFNGAYIWTDGSNTYYSMSANNYVLNGDTWEPKTWNGPEGSHLGGPQIWTDGINYYYSYSTYQYVRNGDTWEPKTWNGLTNIYANCVWTDGTNYYYSYGPSNQYVLNGDTWEPKTWNGLTDFYGRNIWTDGTYIYYSSNGSSNQYVLNGDTWEPKTWETWNGYTPVAGDIWTDGTNYYYSTETNNYVFS